jgi:hypothetical protein
MARLRVRATARHARTIHSAGEARNTDTLTSRQFVTICCIHSRVPDINYASIDSIGFYDRIVG